MSFYDEQSIFTERVILAEDIILPEDMKDYKDTIGKFFFPIMTPMLKMDEPRELIKNGYKSSNYISLYIPRYILLNFNTKISKGTEFIIASIDRSIKIDDFRIIGIYTIPTN